MRLVLDTNVALSALLWRGTPYRLLAAIRQRGDVPLISSAALLEELAGVLTRPSPARRPGLVGKSAATVMADDIDAVEVVAPTEVPRVVPADADDDHVLAAAVESGAELIVSGDSDLLRLGRHRGIGIVSAAEAMVALAPR